MPINNAAKKLGNDFNAKLTKEHEAAHDSFDDRITKLVSDAKEGKWSKLKFASEFFKLMRTGAEEAYDRGRQSTGKAIDADSSKTYAALLVTQQAPFIYKFGDDVRLNRGNMDKVRRAEMYGVQLDAAFMAGLLRACPSHWVVEWKLGPTEHCEDCEHISGDGPYTVGTMPTVPGAGETSCLSNCGCYLKVVKVEAMTGRCADDAILENMAESFSEGPSAAAKAIYVFPDKKTWPIGTLKQAKVALVYATWPKNAKVKDQVVKAVLAKWPQLKGVGAAK